MIPTPFLAIFVYCTRLMCAYWNRPANPDLVTLLC